MNGDRRTSAAGGCSTARSISHCRSQRLAEVHDPRRIDVGATGQVRSGGAAVCGEPVLRRSPGISAVAPIIDEKHLQSVPMERRRQGPPVRSIAGVSVEDQNGDARRGSGCREEPAAQLEPVARLERHRLDPGQPDFTGRRHATSWEVHQAALHRPDERQDGSDNDDNISSRDDHRAAHLNAPRVGYFRPSRCLTLGQSRLSARKAARSGQRKKRVRGALQADRGTGAHPVVVPGPHGGVVGEPVEQPLKAGPLSARVVIVRSTAHLSRRTADRR